MTANRLPWEKIDNEQKLQINSSLYEKAKIYRLWFEYLRLSPSFLYAHKLENNLLTKEEKEKPPVELELVLKTYNDFKEIYRRPFWAWFFDDGSDYFGITNFYKSSEPNIKKVATIKRNTNETNGLYLSKVKTYLESRDLNAKLYSELLVSIPIDLEMNTNDILKELRLLIEHAKSSELRPRKIRYELHPCKFRYSSLEMGLKVLWTFAENPSLKLHEVGKLVDISDTYRDIDIPEKYDSDEQRQQMNSLRGMTKRAEIKAFYVMENAARGRFPSYDKIDLPVIDYKEIGDNRSKLHQSDKKWFSQFEQSTPVHPLDAIIHKELFGY